MRTISDNAAELLKGIEKLSLVPYDDQTGEQIDEWCQGATIGYGHLIRQGEWSALQNGITQEGAESLFVHDYEPTIDAVDAALPADCLQQEFDACVILAFNIGVHGFTTSSVCKILNGLPTHYDSIDPAWMAWDKSQGEVNEGLNNRRQCELRIFHEGIYERW